jgi:hypothetical protein
MLRHPLDQVRAIAMTSRTFPLSRQRRRRIAPKGLLPVQDGQRYAAPSDEDNLGDEIEREPAPARTPTAEPVDPATHGAGARPSGPRLPHEHDENTDPPLPPREPIIQAEADLIEGRQDTDLRGKAREVFDKAISRRHRR